MKNSIKYIAVATLFFLASCGNNEETPTPSTTNAAKKQQISMQVNGVAYSVNTGEVASDNIYAHIANDRNRFNLTAAKGDKDFSITQINAKLDTLNSIQNNGVFVFSQWEDGANIYSTIANTKGKMNYLITKKDAYASGFHLVEGSFYGVLYNAQKTDSVVITNGQIKIID